MSVSTGSTGGRLESWVFIWIYSNWRNSVFWEAEVGRGPHLGAAVCRGAHLDSRRRSGSAGFARRPRGRGPCSAPGGSGERPLPGFDPRVQLGRNRHELGRGTLNGNGGPGARLPCPAHPRWPRGQLGSQPRTPPVLPNACTPTPAPGALGPTRVLVPVCTPAGTAVRPACLGATAAPASPTEAHGGGRGPPHPRTDAVTYDVWQPAG